jgi:hypothetical protein
LAVQLSNTADRDQQTVLDEKMSIQLELSKIASHNVKVGGAVDSHTDELGKLSTCNKEVKKDADEQYKKGLAEIDKLKKEMMEKVAEVKQNQQGQQGNKDVKSMSDTDLDNYIQRNKQEAGQFAGKIAAENTNSQPNQNRISNLEKEKKIRQENVRRGEQEKSTRTPKPGGRRRVTMRRHRVY